ncbi:apolipo protein O-domain-containing protein, partial [Kalaharituber pfeilii]
SPSLEPTRPTPTDRLATHIRTARQFINTHYSVLSHRFNEYLNQYLHYEHTVTSTVASLAPPKGSGEQVVPGSIYVLVTAMAGSILTRRRIWPIRILTPIVVATGASWYFLPLTTRNVGELLWHFEKKVPAVAETHLQIRKTAEDNIAVIRQNIVETRKVVDENVTKGRETIEEWVKKQ